MSVDQRPGRPIATVPRAASAETYGLAWLEATRAVLDAGSPGSYEGAPMLELLMLDIAVEDATQDDAVVASLGDPERLAWMHSNFTRRVPVAELGAADSYATRLYDYEHTGRDQISWVIERLRADPSSRSAIVTTLQPRSDSTYVPCVSLLHFLLPAGLDGELALVATAHSIDLGTKGCANLVELVEIQRRVASQLGVAAGSLLLRITSAHVYERDVPRVRAMLGAVPSDA